MKALQTGSFSRSLFEVPENEASSLFVRIVTRFVQECAFNPEHGLDCYLSLRIRHGTLSGLLRGPVAHENLVTRRSATGEYKENEYWMPLLAQQLSWGQLATIGEMPQSFSQEYDDIIANLTNEHVQIRREEKHSGWFEITMPTPSILGLATEILPETSFGEFLNKCFDLFWAL